MGCLLIFLRPLFTFIFSLIILVAFILYLALNSFSTNVLSADFYNDALAENEVYDRFYDEVLLDPEFQETKDELLGDIEVPTEDIAMVARAIMPSSYLQAEVERTINATVAYLSKDTDDLELHVDLAIPLENAKEQLLKYVDDRIEELEVVPAPTRQDLEEQMEEVFRQVQEGKIPTQVPSLESIPVEERLAAYDFVLNILENDRDSVPEEILELLEDPQTKQAIEDALVSEDPLKSVDLRGALKQATGGLAGPLIDDALDELRKELVTSDGRSCENLGSTGIIIRVGDLVGLVDRPESADCTRFDVLRLAAEGATDKKGEEAEEEFLSDLDSSRDAIGLIEKFGTWAAILIIVVFSGLLAFVHLPRFSASLRWPGMVLGATGLVFLVVGVVLKSVLPGRLDSLVEEGAERTDLPESVFFIATDVATNMATNIASGFIGPSIVLLVIGGGLFAFSFFLRRIPFMLLGCLKR